MKKRFTSAAKVTELAQSTADAYAQQVLDFKAIKTTITDAAAKGRYRVRIVQEEAINLQDTEMAQLLTEQLKKQGYFIDWLTASKMVKFEGSALVEHEQYTEMEIRWGTDKPREQVRSEHTILGELQNQE